jgi:hypothetical protein
LLHWRPHAGKARAPLLVHTVMVARTVTPLSWLRSRVSQLLVEPTSARNGALCSDLGLRQRTSGEAPPSDTTRRRPDACTRPRPLDC